MGVYIKHMKMPESCILCRLECLYRIHSSSARSEYCPLIEIADHKDEPQTETSTNNSTISEKLQLTKCDLCRREGGDVCVDCERKKQSGKE